MAKDFTIRLPDEVAADVEALARAEGKSLNETVRTALIEAVERRRGDPEFEKTLAKIIEQEIDQEKELSSASPGEHRLPAAGRLPGHRRRGDRPAGGNQCRRCGVRRARRLEDRSPSFHGRG